MVNYSKIKVDIYIPTYNRGKYISQTISSLLIQTHSNISITIVDNASEDNTEVIVKEIKDPRVFYIKNQTNIGAMNNFNKCIELAILRKDQVMCIFHSEDLYHPSIIERELNLIMKSDDIGACFSNLKFIDENSEELTKVFKKGYEKDCILSEIELIEHTLSFGTPLVCPTFMAKTSIFKTIGLINNNYIYAGDTEFYIRISKYFKIGIVNDALVKYRLSSIQESSIQNKNKHEISEEFMLLSIILKEYYDKLSKVVIDAYKRRLSNEYISVAHFELLNNGRKEVVSENNKLSISSYKYPFFSKTGFRQRLLKYRGYSLYKFLNLILNKN